MGDAMLREPLIKYNSQVNEEKKSIMAIIRSSTAHTHRCYSFVLHVFDIIMILTLVAAASALMVLGILALIAETPFETRSLATGITFLCIACLCIVCIAGYTILVGSRQATVYGGTTTIERNVV